MRDGRPIIVFDGVCNFCSAWVSFVLRWDRAEQFLFAPAQCRMGSELLATTGFAQGLLRTILLVSDSGVHSKSDAIIEICSRFGGPWKMAKVARLVPRSLRDWAYDVIARNRYALGGRRSECMIPPPAVRLRFLD